MNVNGNEDQVFKLLEDLKMMEGALATAAPSIFLRITEAEPRIPGQQDEWGHIRSTV